MVTTEHRADRGVAMLTKVRAVIAAIALVVGAAVALLLAWWAGLIVAAAVAAGLWFAVVNPRLGGAEERVLALVGPLRDPDPDVLDEARLLNLVEGLAPNAGLPRPRCLICDDPAVNALVVGDARSGSFVVTTALVAGMNRMDLEAVVAHGLVRLRDGMVRHRTQALALSPGGALAGSADPVPLSAADVAAVALTRYPPGLIAALRVIAASGPTAPHAAKAVVGPLWMAAPGDAAALGERIAALEEL